MSAGCCYGGAAPNLATAFSTTAFNLGVTISTGIAAGAYAAVGPTGPVLVGAAAFGLLFIPLLALLTLHRGTGQVGMFADRPIRTHPTDDTNGALTRPDLSVRWITP